jgi:DNA-binding response OmpR family regulator
VQASSLVAVNADAQVNPQALPAPPREPRILVAEDDTEMRRFLVEVLRKEHFDVVEARDGFRVLDHVGTSLIAGSRIGVDLVVSDIRMPGANGLQILSGLRAHDPTLPVILITAFGNPEMHAEAKRRGAVAVIDKPFDVAELLSVIRSVLPRGDTDGEVAR